MLNNPKLPKLILTDIDGVWTDGGMYYSSNGIELKKFNTADSAGVLFAKLLNIPVGIITGESTDIVQNRANKLKVDYLFLGISDKPKVVDELILKLGISMKDVAYIGDDINDIELLKRVGISACPMDASILTKNIVDRILDTKGGDGVFREFVEWIISDAGISLEEIYASYLSKIQTFKQ